MSLRSDLGGAVPIFHHFPRIFIFFRALPYSAAKRSRQILSQLALSRFCKLFCGPIRQQIQDFYQRQFDSRHKSLRKTLFLSALLRCALALRQAQGGVELFIFNSLDL